MKTSNTLKWEAGFLCLKSRAQTLTLIGILMLGGLFGLFGKTCEPEITPIVQFVPGGFAVGDIIMADIFTDSSVPVEPAISFHFVYPQGSFRFGSSNLLSVDLDGSSICEDGNCMGEAWVDPVSGALHLRIVRTDGVQVVPIGFVARVKDIFVIEDLNAKPVDPNGLDNPAKQGITVSPNPAQSRLVIKITAGDPIHEINFLDMYGRIVKTFGGGGEKVKLNLGDLPRGQYILQISRLGGVEKPRIIILN